MYVFSLFFAFLMLGVESIDGMRSAAPAKVSSRFKTFLASAGSWLVLTGGQITVADEELPVEQKVTAVAKLDVSIQRAPPRTVLVGLYGESAPESTRRFLSFCSGDNEYKSAGLPFKYDGAQVSTILKGSSIEVGKFAQGSGKKLATKMSESGKVSLSSIDLGEDLLPTQDPLGSVPMTKGIVSMPKKGSFKFFITSGEKQDKEFASKNVVVGKIVNEEGIEVVDAIDKIPVSREDILGTKGAFSGAGKGFDPRAKLASINRPLQRVEVLSCTVSEKASLSSFLKF